MTTINMWNKNNYILWLVKFNNKIVLRPYTPWHLGSYNYYFLILPLLFLNYYRWKEYIFVDFSHEKGITRNIIINLFNYIYTQFNKKIKCVGLNNGKEFNMPDFYARKGWAWEVCACAEACEPFTSRGKSFLVSLHHFSLSLDSLFNSQLL